MRNRHAVSAFLVFAFLFSGSLSASAEEYQIRWILAHEPVKAFESAANYFRDTVEARTKGAVKVRTMTVKEFNGGKTMMEDEVYDHLKHGDFEMCQTFGSYLGAKHPQFWVFDLPFLFRSYEHAEHVIKGPLGKQILTTLEEDNLRGLGITYSGGFRVIPTVSRKITKFEDLRGARLRVPHYASVSNAMYEKLGAIPMPMGPTEGGHAQAQGSVDGLETTIPRFWDLSDRDASHVVNALDHSLYVTALVINKAFLEKMPEEYQKIVMDVARETAEHERADAIRIGEDTKKEMAAHGVQLVQMSAKERLRMKKATEAVYGNFSPMIGAELIQKVRETK